MYNLNRIIITLIFILGNIALWLPIQKKVKDPIIMGREEFMLFYQVAYQKGYENSIFQEDVMDGMQRWRKDSLFVLNLFFEENQE